MMNQDQNNMNQTGMSPNMTPVNNTVNPSVPQQPSMQNVVPPVAASTEPVAPVPPVSVPPAAEPSPVNTPNTVGGFVTPPKPVEPAPVAPQPITEPQASTISQAINQGVQPTAPQMNTGTVQPAPVMDGNMNGQQPLPPEEKPKKKTSPVVVVLLIVLLTAIGIAAGYYLFTKFGSKNEPTTEPTPVTPDTNLSNNVISNNGVDATNLNTVLDIVGIAPVSTQSNNNLLNYYVSNENYQEHAKDIITYYGANMGMFGTVPEDIAPSEGLVTVSKDKALNILKLFNLNDDITNYFEENESLEDSYLFTTTNTSIPSFANGESFGITHNLTAENVDDTNISVVDTQAITSYGEDGVVLTENKVVTYNFYLDDDGNYNLNKVTVTDNQ